MAISRKLTVSTYLLCILGLYSVQVRCQKTLFNEEQTGILLNEPLDKIDEYMKDVDYLTLLFVYDSEKEKSQQVLSQVMLPIIQETRDLIKVYAYDCSDSMVKKNIKRFESCSKPDELPYISLLKPPLHKVDPISLDLNKPETIPYTERELTPTNFYNYIIKNMPDFTRVIDNIHSLEDFRDQMVNLDINKVLIFSKKQKQPVLDEFKALASAFKDRLQVGVVPYSAEEVRNEFPEVKNLPEVMILISYDTEKNTTMDRGQRVILNETAPHTVPLMIEFLKQFARKDRKSDLRSRQLTPYIEIFTEDQFKNDILLNEKACVVFFSDNKLPIERQHLMFNYLNQTLKKAIVMAAFYIGGSHNNSEAYLLEQKELKERLRLGHKFPMVRFYPNGFYGEERDKKSIQLSIGRGDALDKLKVMSEIHDNFVHDVREINERYINTQAVNNAVEHKKHTLIYFFDDDKVSLHFKAISALEWLQEDFIFYSVHNPSPTLQRDYFIDKLPAIRGALANDNDDDLDATNNVKQFQYGGTIDFDDILYNLLRLTNKKKQYEQRQKELLDNRRKGVQSKDKSRKVGKKTKKSKVLQAGKKTQRKEDL